MLLFSIGLPSRFSTWCDALLGRLADRLEGDHTEICWPPLSDMFGYETASAVLDQLAQAMIASGAHHLVVAARQPDPRVRDALAAGNAPFVLALDDPRNSVPDILAASDADPKHVVRAVANSCPLVMPFEGLPGALIVRSDGARDDPAGTVSRIAEHFGIRIGLRAAALIATELSALAPWSGRPASLPAPDSGSQPDKPAVQKMIDGALLGYRHRFLEGRLDQIVWTRDLFMLAADPGKSPTEPIDIAGGYRILIFGPYIHLPPGSWAAQVILGFSFEGAPARFLIEVFADRPLATANWEPQRSGTHTADLAFSIGEPSGKGVEIRVWVTGDQGIGRLAFGRVTLQPLSVPLDLASGRSNDFASVLEL